jgi:hypothetical protein
MKPFSNIGFRISNRFRALRKRNGPENIPVIINNRNRYTMLKQLISKLEEFEIKNIHIIDNNSDYPPLLHYYKEIPYTVYLLDSNVGCYSLWKTHIFQRFKDCFYIYTDSDVVPVEECPNDLLTNLKNELLARSDIDKVGLGLKIDDLPDENDMKQKIISWEKQYWEKPLSPLLYEAPIDTTFALYKPGKQGGWWLKSARTGYPYIARHLPWYLNSSAQTEEEQYYIQHASIDSSWYKNPEKNQ